MRFVTRILPCNLSCGQQALAVGLFSALMNERRFNCEAYFVPDCKWSIGLNALFSSSSCASSSHCQVLSCVPPLHQLQVKHGMSFITTGSMVGKALYEGILLEAALAPFFVLRLQGRAPTFDDLLSLDPDLHRSLTQVRSASMHTNQCSLAKFVGLPLAYVVLVQQ